jgi:hypothetical protein
MLKSIRKRTELQRLSDLLSHDGFRCSVVRPGRQFSMWLPFRVKVSVSFRLSFLFHSPQVIYPGEREPTKKWKAWESWLLSDMLVFGEREKSKTADRLVVKVGEEDVVFLLLITSQVWLPLEQVLVEQLAEEASSSLAASGSVSAIPRLAPAAVATSEGAMSKRALRKETKEAPVAKELRECVCLAANGAQLFLASDDRAQAALWLKKLHKKLALIKQYTGPD